MKEIYVTGEGQALIVKSLAANKNLEILSSDNHTFKSVDGFVYLACHEFDYKKECGFTVNLITHEPQFKSGQDSNYDNKTFKYKVITSDLEFQNHLYVEHKDDGGSVAPVVIRLTKTFYLDLTLSGHVTETSNPKAAKQASQEQQRLDPQPAPSSDNANASLLEDGQRSDGEQRSLQGRQQSCCTPKVKVCAAVTLAVGAIATIGFLGVRHGWFNGNHNQHEIDSPSPHP